MKWKQKQYSKNWKYSLMQRNMMFRVHRVAATEKMPPKE
jgi:hypothetical protein